MLQRILNKLFGSNGSEQTKPLREDVGSGFYITYNEAPNGYGGYCYVNICLHSEKDPSLHRRITDGRGNFIHFPGCTGGKWEQELDIAFKPCVCFPCRIGPFENGRAKFMWQVQPDGRYFADEDGFGAEKCDEIWLYSYIDEKGSFTGPFVYEER